MAQQLEAPATRRAREGFTHEALIYRGVDQFLETVGRFITDAIAARERVLVMVDAAKAERLRAVVGHDLGVEFADMNVVGRNPACIIPVWRAFVAAHRGATAVRGVAEPVTAERGPDELAECHLHEALLNDAFDAEASVGAPSFWLVCAYDADALDRGAVATAGETHPFVSDGMAQWESDAFTADSIDRFAEPLPDPPGHAATMAFGRREIRMVRRFVAHHAAAHGLSAARTDDLVLAVDEVATNSVRHASGLGTIAIWRNGDTVTSDVRDGGRIHEPMVGRRLPRAEQPGGRGLWIVNRLCDLVQVRSSASGTTVRMQVAIV